MTTFFESADINVLGRFPGADVCGDTGSGVVGTNMYAYCNNDPVMFVDPEGTSSIVNMIQVVFVVANLISALAKSIRLA